LHLLGVIEEVELSDIKPSNNPLRKDVCEGLEELIHSIKMIGLVNPIVVRPINDSCFEIIAGHRRFQACKQLGWKKVPCQVVDLDERKAYELALVENIQAKSLNPIEEALAFKKYVDEKGWGSVSELAKRIGKSQSYVSARLSLLKLPKEIQEAIISRQITPTVAQELVTLSNQQMLALFDQIRAHKLSRSIVRRMKREICSEKQVTDDSFLLPIIHTDAHHQKIRMLTLYKSVLKLALQRINEVLSKMEGEEDGVLFLILLELRQKLNNLIDEVIKITMKTRRLEKIA
jgi:ParB family chromosome partitioning protein